jgi:Uma2 family endonuclease
MATAELEVRPETTTRSLVGEQRLLIPDVSYSFYKIFCEEIGERPLRLSFTDGDLEIMVTKRPHEYFKKVLAKLLEQLVFCLNIPVASGGNMTFQRDDLEKGFEPDECWWIAHEAIVRSKEEFDFTVDPPPDLAIEIEISHSLVNRISIYAAMQVPEIWRYDGTQLRFCVLQPDGTYESAPYSLAFPFLAPSDLEPFLPFDPSKDETSRLREFVDWIRSQNVE